MNLKLNLICALLFCFSFFKGIGQTAEENVKELAKCFDYVNSYPFVTKNNPADEPYRQELYKRHLEAVKVIHGKLPTNDLWKLPNSNTHSISELKSYRKNGRETSGLTASNFSETYCMKITKISYNELGQMIRDIEDCLFYGDGGNVGYGADNFFECSDCTPQAVGGVNVPPLFLVGEAPCARMGFLARVYQYYILKRKEPEKWIEVINSKNTNGETILDFFKTLETHGNYNTDETRACAKEDIKFICEHGGVHAFGKGTKDDYCECLKNK